MFLKMIIIRYYKIKTITSYNLISCEINVENYVMVAFC